MAFRERGHGHATSRRTLPDRTRPDRTRVAATRWRTPGAPRRDRPLIDVSPALGEAGHETELLGYEGIADTAPVLRDAGAAEDPRDVEEQILGSMATRGCGGVT